METIKTIITHPATLFVVAAFLLILGLHQLLGGDQAQSKRSDWYPLRYIIPIMISMFLVLKTCS